VLSNTSQYIIPGVHNITVVYPQTENYSVSSETHWIIVEDTTDPGITIISPLEADIVGWTVLLRANVTDLNLDTVRYQIRNGTATDAIIDSGMMNNIGGDVFNGTLYTNDTWPYAGLNSTNLTLIIIANDTSGNEYNTSTTWILDNTQPSIQHITPTSRILKPGF